jgi:hypothetical protein
VDEVFAIRVIERDILGELRLPEIATEEHLEAMATLEASTSPAPRPVCSASNVEPGATWADIVTSLRWQLREDAQEGKPVSRPALEWLSQHGR